MLDLRLLFSVGGGASGDYLGHVIYRGHVTVTETVVGRGVAGFPTRAEIVVNIFKHWHSRSRACGPMPLEYSCAEPVQLVLFLHTIGI